MKSSRITRIVQILTVMQSGQNYSVEDLVKILGKSRRTIFRDLAELRAVGVSYCYNTKGGGYNIDPNFFLPPLDLNLQEALSLLLLVHRGRGHIQLPFKNSALMAVLKIENILPAKIRQYCNNILKNVSARAGGQAPTDLLDSTFAELQGAIVNKTKVVLTYHSLFDNGVIDVDLCPYHLMYNHRAWYVVGYSSQHKSLRTFKFNRIKKLRVQDERFVSGDDFDVYEYFGRAWSMIPEGKLYNIKLRFLPKVAKNVTEVQWHSTQQAQHNRDGSATMEFRVDGLGEIIWWILGYGDQVEVLAPKVLREKVVATAKNIIRVNQTSDDKKQG